MEVFILSSKKIKGTFPASIEDAMKSLLGPEPSTVIRESASLLFHQKQMFRRIITIFEFSGYPAGWDIDFFITTLLRRGHIAIGYTKAYGVIPMECTYYGLNIFNRPTNALVVSHDNRIGNLDLKLGSEAILIYMQNDYNGVMPLINMYASRLANIDASENVNLINAKVAYIFDCEDSDQAKTAQSIYDDISSGKPAVFTRRNSSALMNNDGGIRMTQNNVTQTYIVDKLQDARNGTESQFDSAIGINNSPVDKKERVNTLEVKSNNQRLIASVKDWHDNMTRTLDAANSLFDLTIKMEMPFYDELISDLEGGDESGID